MPAPTKIASANSITRKIVTGVMIAAASTAALSACSSGASSDLTSASPVSSPTSTPTPTPSGTPITLEATLTSSSKSNLEEVGDKQAYGFEPLSGSTQLNNHSVKIKLLQAIDLTDGSGSVTGFLKLSWSDGTELGLRVQGDATYDGASKTTDYDNSLTVINGTDEAKGTTGSGSLTGSRKLGSSSMKVKIALTLANAPEEITGVAKGSARPSASYSATIEP